MFYIATRDASTREVRVEHYLYTNHQSAVESAAKFTERHDLKRRNVIVVEASDDVEALITARRVFARRN